MLRNVSSRLLGLLFILAMAPTLAAVGAIAALVSEATIVVEKEA